MAASGHGGRVHATFNPEKMLFAFLTHVIQTVAPNIDKGYSKSVKANRPAIWQIKVKGEPPPMFKWFKDGQQIHHSPEFVIERKEFQGGAVAMLTISRTQVWIYF